MSGIDITVALAGEHVRDLRASAAQYRFTAPARDARRSRAPRVVSAAIEGIAAWGRRGQLGPVNNVCTCS